MEKNNYIIIGLIVIIIALIIGIGTVLFLQSDVAYETIHISNGTTIDVPKTDDKTWSQDEYGIKTYTSPSKHTVMMSFNSAEDLNLVGAGGFASARDMLLTGSSHVEMYNNYEIKENTINNTHYYIVFISNAATHDNIVIASTDLNILKHMIDSIVFGSPAVVTQQNATIESESSPETTNTPSNNNNNNKNKYTEDDLARANQNGYISGYSDGYLDSYDDYNYYNDYYDDSYSESSSIDSGQSESQSSDQSMQDQGTDSIG